MTTRTAARPRDLTPQEQGAEVDRWILDPLYWAKKFMGEEFDPSPGQEELWNQYGRLLNAKLKRYQLGPQALTDEENTLADKFGISVRAGHGLGKERSVSGIGCHYHFVLQEYQTKGVCTAPAGPTLHSTLWPEFGKIITSSPYLHALYHKQADRIFLKDDPKRGEFSWIKPRTIQATSNADAMGTVLAGIHALGVLYLITEASEVPEPVFKPIEGGLTDPLSLIIMIANPTRRTGFFAESHMANRKHWICLHWDGRELKQQKLAAPGRYKWFNERVQDALIDKYGEDSDTVAIRVIGDFPKQSADTLIHFEAAMEAKGRMTEILENDPLCVFVDVGGEGEDPSVVTVLRGPRVLKQVDYRQKDTTQLADLVADEVAGQLASLGTEVQYAIGVDGIGLGRGVYDILQHIHRVQHLYKLDVSEVPLDAKRFHRLRDQVWWELRDGFMEARECSLYYNVDDRQAGEAMQHVDTLIGEITSIKWGEVNGKIKVQGKGSSSGIPNVKPLAKSPNFGDSLCGAWYLYKHCVSRVPAAFRRMRRYSRRRVSWKVA